MGADLDVTSLLPEGVAVGSIKEFIPCARYIEPMDVVVYIQEDLAYRADRVDPFLTLLWHPHEQRAIGFKLKGFRWLFANLQEILKEQSVGLEEDSFLSMISAIQFAMVAGGGAMLEKMERDRLAEKYAEARRLAKGIKFDSRQLPTYARAA